MFDSNRKKTFHSQALNRLTVLERLTWLIPVGFIVREIIYTHSEIEEVLHDSPSPAVIIALIIAILFVTALQAGFWFLLAKVLFHFARKQIMRNNSFITVEDLDYYRDKLTGLSPGTISLLTDLKIEPKKDRAACILKYENMGILKMEEKRYIVNTDVPEFASLRESDRFLLNALCNGTFNAQKEGNWIYMLQKEAVADGYLTSRLSSTDKQKETTSTCSRCVLGCSAPLFFIVIMSFVFYAFKDRVNAYFEILDALPETASFGEQTNYLLQYPEYLPVLAGLMIMVLLFFLCLIIPLLVFVGTISSGFTKAHFKRTTLGNQMTEYIYGMKNFIHDFSNLSEATQNELVLWDDKMLLQELSKTSPYAGLLADAPQAIITAYRKDCKIPEYAQIDMSIAMENMWLATDEIGLGGVWIGIAPVKERMQAVEAILKLPEDQSAFGIFALGYPAEEKKQEDRYDTERVHFL